MINNLSFLKIWHKTFALHLEYTAEGFEEMVLDPEIVGNPAACQVGNWLSQSSQLAETTHYAELVTCHAEFHRIAQALIIAHNTQDEKAKAQLIDQFKTASESVTAAVDQLETALHQNNKAIVPAHQEINDHRSVWDDSLLLGIPVIDQQHQEIAKLIDVALCNPTKKLNSELGTQFLSNLQKLVFLHFDTEEMLMERIGLSSSAIDEHKAAHRSILEKLSSLAYDLTFAKPEMLLSDIYPLIEEGIIDHVIECDMSLRADYQAYQAAASIKPGNNS